MITLTLDDIPNILMYSTPLILGAMGGVISERCGVVNIGIDGMMCMGAFTAATAGYFLANPWLGLLFGGLAGGLIALLHAIACVTFNADQTISGTALNLIGPGLALFISRLVFAGSTQTLTVSRKMPKIFSQEVSGIFRQINIDVTSLIALIIVILFWFVLYKTKWGLRIRAVGEHPAAAETLGINVRVLRYACVIMSGFFAGIGGGCVTLSTVSCFSPTSISGQGFIALAAVIFGKWMPHRACGACLLFGFAQILTVKLSGEKSLIPSQIIAMLPYVLTILILILFVGKSVAPKASGKPYNKNIC